MFSSRNKTQAARLGWYEHAMRSDGESVDKRTLDMEVEGRRRRGRAKTRWKDRIGERRFRIPTRQVIDAGGNRSPRTPNQYKDGLIKMTKKIRVLKHLCKYNLLLTPFHYWMYVW